MSNRAIYKPFSVQSHHFVGVKIFMEIHHRILKGQFGKIPEALSEDAFSMGDYCLDAFDTIPAGSMQYEEFGEGEDDWIWSPTTIEREQ